MVPETGPPRSRLRGRTLPHAGLPSPRPGKRVRGLSLCQQQVRPRGGSRAPWVLGHVFAEAGMSPGRVPALGRGPCRAPSHRGVLTEPLGSPLSPLPLLARHDPKEREGLDTGARVTVREGCSLVSAGAGRARPQPCLEGPSGCRLDLPRVHLLSRMCWLMHSFSKHFSDTCQAPGTEAGPGGPAGSDRDKPLTPRGLPSGGATRSVSERRRRSRVVASAVRTGRSQVSDARMGRCTPGPRV